MEFKRRIPHNVHIRAALNGGFIVQVGCVSFPYFDVEILLQDLRDYLKFPKETIKKYEAIDRPRTAMDAAVKDIASNINRDEDSNESRGFS